MLNPPYERRRSRSLSNIEDENGDLSHDSHHQVALAPPSFTLNNNNSTVVSTTNKTKGLNLLNKLHKKLSKSNSDLTQNVVTHSVSKGNPNLLGPSRQKLIPESGDVTKDVSVSSISEISTNTDNGVDHLHKELFSELLNYKGKRERELHKQLFSDIRAYRLKRRNSVGSDELISDPCDEVDGSTSIQIQLEKVERKIDKTKEEILQLQEVRDENVHAYLRDFRPDDGANNAKMRSIFERSNQKTNSSITFLQKKLEKYQQQAQHLEQGVQGSKNIIKVVQDSVRSGASHISGAVSKPLESLNNRKRRGVKKVSSSDNVFIMAMDDDDLERCSSPCVNVNRSNEGLDCMPNHSLASSRNKCQITKMEHQQRMVEFEALESRVVELEQSNRRSRSEMDELAEKVEWTQETTKLEEEKTLCIQHKLNELMNQWNELTELHQNEMRSMRSELDSSMEHIDFIEYRFQQRTADLEEHLDKCLTKISKIEKYQQEHQPVENYLDISAKLLLSNCLSFLINISLVVIFFINALKKIATRDKYSVMVSAVTLIGILIVWNGKGMTYMYHVISDYL